MIKRVVLVSFWIILLAALTTPQWTKMVNHHVPNERLAPVGWVIDTFPSVHGATTFYLSADGPEYKPVAFHGGIGGISLPQVQDYVINNPPATRDRSGSGARKCIFLLPCMMKVSN